ncbi:MAG: sigma-70 family RNA polymerase sigma factor [Myxococcales bacterium]|nr:sigma-70 family RNA polymerase sigma factor [Myxococcales bacterium]
MSGSAASDGDLLLAWRSGDAVAGRALFARHSAAVQRFFRGVLGAEREDLIQQTFLACLESIDRLRTAASFRTFLLSIARHKLYDHLSRRAGVGARFDPLISTAMELGAASPSQVVGDRLRHDRVLEQLRHLPIELQLVIELHYWEELDTAAIAEILDIPRGTVKTRLMRARDQLRVRLGPELDDDGARDGSLRALGARLGEPSGDLGDH